jgi:predicted alpha/beta-hydrolase family hydrolase
MQPSAEPLRIDVDAAVSVSGLLTVPPRASACYVFAHGAGAGMTHRFMQDVAQGLFARGIACLRYQFPYMERGSRRPDAPALAHKAVQAAVAAAGEHCPKLPLLAGGKSFGGRMTSQAQALAPLPGVRGLVFFGFPLHPAGKPARERAKHLSDVQVPMLFIQGTRDSLGEIELVRGVVKELKPRASLYEAEGADHSLHVSAKAGRDADVLNAALDAMAAWVAAVIGKS